MELNNGKTRDGAPDSKNISKIDFPVSDFPPIEVTILYGLQQVLANISGPLASVFIIHAALCTKDKANSDLLFAELLGATMVIMGVCTLLQVLLGVRLPILQGSSSAFIAPILAMMNTTKWKCPDCQEDPSHLDCNATEPWIPRMNAISGSLMVASTCEILLGMGGFLGYIMPYIGPLTITPTVSMVGFTLVKAATASSSTQFGVALFTVALVFIFSLILGTVQIPIPSYSRKNGCRVNKLNFFRLFPHFLAILFGWLLCYILTVSGALSNDPNDLNYYARTDSKIDVIGKAAWISIPYPGRYGAASFDAGVFAGLLGATLSSIIESIGDYYATARISYEPPPPKNAISRGIGVEGLGCVLCGAFNVLHGTTSYSGTIGFIGLTKLASRSVWVLTGVYFIFLGIFGKFTAVLAIVPSPVIGGLTLVAAGMVMSVAFSNLKFIDLDSSRNQMILGTSIMLGLMFPYWLSDGGGKINTGLVHLDQILTVLLSTGMVVAGTTGFLLDNLIPGTIRERGILNMNQAQLAADIKDGRPSVYELPFIRSYHRLLRYLPFLPIYDEKPNVQDVNVTDNLAFDHRENTNL